MKDPRKLGFVLMLNKHRFGRAGVLVGDIFGQKGRTIWPEPDERDGEWLRNLGDGHGRWRREKADGEGRRSLVEMEMEMEMGNPIFLVGSLEPQITLTLTPPNSKLFAYL